MPKLIMSRIFYTAVLLALFGLGSVYAKDSADIARELAPLITDSTLLVVRVDLEMLDLDLIYGNLLKGLDESLAKIGFDQISVERISKESKKTFTKIRDKFKEHLSVLKDDAKIDALYCILQCEADVGESDTVCMFTLFAAVPVKGRTKKQRQTWLDIHEWLALLNDDEESIGLFQFTHADFDLTMFQFAIIDGEEITSELNQDTAKAVFRNPKKDAETILKQAFTSVENQPLQFVYFYTKNLAAFVQAALYLETSEIEDMKEIFSEFEKISQSFMESMSKVAKMVKWGSASLNPATMKYEIFVQTASESDAKEVCKIFETLFDSLGDLYSNIVRTLPTASRYAPFVGELVKGAYRVMMPEVEGDRLVLRLELGNLGKGYLAFYSIIAYAASASEFQ